MDSLTQMALGASCAGMVAGQRLRTKALLIGAVVGSLPDLDVLVPFSGAVESFTYHRSFSHSLIVLTIVSPLIAGVLWRVFRADGLTFARWWLLSWLALITHPLLDSFTVYGTQLFWPLSDYPVSGSSVFIIDPVYTVILLCGIAALARSTKSGYFWNVVCFGCACCYLLWSVAAKVHIQQAVERNLALQGVSYQRLLTTPIPFNTLGWRFVAMQENGYLAGYSSLLDPDDHQVVFQRFGSDEHLLESLGSHWPVARLRYFTHGFYKVWENNADVLITDLRMGVEGAYIFNFVVGRVESGGVVAVNSREAETDRDFSSMTLLFKRVFDPTIQIHR